MSTTTATPRLAVDIGGTFTDVVLERSGERATIKVLTTPGAPEVGLGVERGHPGGVVLKEREHVSVSKVAGGIEDAIGHMSIPAPQFLATRP